MRKTRNVAYLDGCIKIIKNCSDYFHYNTQQHSRTIICLVKRPETSASEMKCYSSGSQHFWAAGYITWN